MATNGFAAKRAIIDQLRKRSLEQGNPLSGVQVLYKFSMSKAEQVCVYGGGFTFDQPGDDDAVDGNRNRLPFEETTVGVHVRVAVSPPPEDEQATDVMAEEIGDEIARLFAGQPNLAGGKSVTRIRGGQADYSPNDDSDTSILSILVSVQSYLTLS